MRINQSGSYRTVVKYVRYVIMFGAICEFLENNNGRLLLHVIFNYGRQGFRTNFVRFRPVFAPIFGQIWYFYIVRREKFNFNAQVIMVGAKKYLIK